MTFLMEVNVMEFPNKIISGYLSSKRDKDGKYEKAKIQRIKIQNQELIQLSLFTNKQVFHSNYNDSEINVKIEELLTNDFYICELKTNEYIYGYKMTSKGKLLTNKRKNNEISIVETHNKKKNYLIEEGMIVTPLVDLGVMLPDGRVVKAHNDKFKQINRFLEIVNDSIGNLEKINIIDFGCGKSYLTFILYYYLTEVKKMDCTITGLDLKDDVVNNCNKIAQKYGYSKLKFLNGDISKFKDDNSVDMIVTLHACDTATDYSLYYAINMNCKYIFSVPCCQHEVNQSIDKDSCRVINKFGILKERYSAIVTDAIRANLLQYCGYKTQVMEFIDIDNSPKNLLIRAIYQGGTPNEKIKEEVELLMKQLGIKQTLYELLFKEA